MCSMYNKRRWFLKGFLFAIVFLGVLSLVLMLLWNSLMPAIFGLTTITYLQALGLLILSKIIFSGFVKKGWHPSSYRTHDEWKEKLRDKFEHHHFGDEQGNQNQ